LQNRPADARAFFADHPTAEAKSPGYEVVFINKCISKALAKNVKSGKIAKDIDEHDVNSYCAI
jgi:hypothetical protein